MDRIVIPADLRRDVVCADVIWREHVKSVEHYRQKLSEQRAKDLIDLPAEPRAAIGQAFLALNDNQMSDLPAGLEDAMDSVRVLASLFSSVKMMDDIDFCEPEHVAKALGSILENLETTVSKIERAQDALRVAKFPKDAGATS